VDGGVLVYTSFPGVRVGWHIIGGTSAASPQLAGLIALTNQLADAATPAKSHVGYLNPLLYSLPSSDFNDIVPMTFAPGSVTIGDNSLFGSGIAGMATTTGFDLTTGFGSPKAYNFVHDLEAAIP
jgi:subtilase family serine protease